MVSQDQRLKRNKEVQILHHRGVEVPDYPRIEKIVKVLCKMLPGKILDIGYSKGSFADYLSEIGWECTGVDLNEHKHPKINIIQGDINEGFPLESEKFDVVTAGEVIEHVIDESVFLKECNRVLKKDGLLVITTPNLCFWINRLLILFGRIPLFVYAPYHYHFHTKDTIINLIGENAFEVIAVKSSHVLYSRRRHFTGVLFEWLGDIFPTFGAHLIVFARKT